MVVTENVYTQHVLAEKVKELSDGAVITLGTLRLNKIDGINRPAVIISIEQVKDEPYGTWRL